MQSFWAELRTQRWDDHRYYHHSRINQSLHFLSAITFLVAYVLMFKDPVAAALLGWLVAMVSRQSGHFFFERRVMTRRIRPRTSTKRPSRSATTCAARWSCTSSGRWCP